MRYLPLAWRLEMLGWLKAHNDEGFVINRFQTHQTGALLAYLALNPNRTHTRDELGDILWPDASVESMRHRFRQALSSLRKQLELPGTPSGSIINADRSSVSLNMEAVSTDVGAFERALKEAGITQEAENKLPLLLRAYELYRGDLLPGYYEECFVRERSRLSDRYGDLLRELLQIYQQVGEPRHALEYAKKLVELDPLQEEAHVDLIRVLEAVGDRAAALRQYQQLEQVLEEELGDEPTAETRALIERLKKSPRSGRPMQTAPRAGGRPKSKTASILVEASDRPRIPMQFTRFFGRLAELDTVRRLIQDPEVKFLTVVGIGGVGKTRLAIQAAQECASSFSDRVYFALLAAIDDETQILDAVAKGVGLSRIPGLSLAQQLAKHLNQYPKVLLVLDNFEHVLGGASIIRDLALDVPGLKCLVTSRHRLRLEGETLLQLPPLEPPPQDWSPADLLKTPRAQMLVDRAQAVMPDFQITDRNAKVIAQICEKLEGIPLAIELAAAWARILSPSQMLEQLTNRFSLLVTKRTDLDERHRTLRAALDYSFSLMSKELQDFFLALSIFRGGWSIKAAQEICDATDTINRLDELLDWSLIVTEGFGVSESSVMRCSMLELIQQYAWEMLPDDRKARLAQKRFEYFIAYTRQKEGEIKGPFVKDAIRDLDSEYANIQACLKWCADNGKAADGYGLANALFPYWYIRSNLSEASHWFSIFLKMDEGGSSLPKTDARYHTVRLQVSYAEYDLAMQTCKECLREYEKFGNVAGMAAALNQMGFCTREQGLLDDSRTHLERGLELARSCGDPSLIASLLSSLGMLAGKQGNQLQVVEHFEEALGLYRGMGDVFQLSICLNNYGFALLLMSAYEDAQPYISESLDIVQDLGLRTTLTARINLSYIHLLKQDLEPAKALLRETLLESNRFDMKRQLYCCIGQLSMIARRERCYEQAALLLFGMMGLAEALGLDTDDPYMKMAHEAVVEFREVLSPVAFALANARGRALPIKDLVNYALASCPEVMEEPASA